MHRQRANPAFGILAVLISGCASPSSRIPPGMPSIPPQAADTGPLREVRSLILKAGQFQYDLVQNASISLDRSRDTASGHVTTVAVLSLNISSENDSSYHVIASIDSLQITATGAVPARSPTAPLSLGPILQASFTAAMESTVQTQLPDSLCAYSQLVAAAREILLPQLPLQTTIPLTRVWVDTTNTTSCRAGTRIEISTTRQLTDLQKDPPQFSLQERTDVRGAGTLRRDSVTVTGSISTQGTVFFTGSTRLPLLVQTQSEGFITVRIGDSTTVFQQTSTLQLQQRQQP